MDAAQQGEILVHPDIDAARIGAAIEGAAHDGKAFLVLRAHGIHVTAMLLVDGDRVLRDGVDVTAEEFHAMLGESGRTLPAR